MEDNRLGTTNHAQQHDRFVQMTAEDQLAYIHFGRVSASLLHEISNPLTAVMLYLEQIKTKHTSYRQVEDTIRQIQKYVEAARQQLRGETQQKWFYARQELRQVQRIMRPLARTNGVHLKITIPSDVRIYGDTAKFQQICANLLLNAIESHDGCEQPTKKHAVCTVQSTGSWLFIVVSDNGPGIDTAMLPRLFEPFQTTKHDSGCNGLGLGLSTVKEYVENDYDGVITVRGKPLEGTSFTAKLRLTPQYHHKPRI